MRRTSAVRTAAVVIPAALLLTAGCGLGADAPHPGVAAEVGHTTLSLGDLDTLVDAACLANAEDSQGQATTRGIAEAQEVTKWIGAQIVLHYAADHDLAVPSTIQDLTDVPGWDEMSHDQREVLQDFVDDQARASEVVGKDAGANQIDATDYHVVINPRFDLDISATKFVPTDRQLSVAVSKDATSQTDQPTAEELAALPSSQICGKVPASS